MKIYIAACFIQQPEVKTKAIELEALGYECTSSWRFETPAGGDGSEPEHEAHYAAAALCDIEDINRADALVLLTGNVSRSGGKHVETGYALAKGKRIIIVGKRAENVFHWLIPEHYETWEKFLEVL